MLQQMQEPVFSKAHARFRHLFNWDGRETVIMSRAIDETGYVQPTREALRAVRGDHSFYHYNGIQHWQIDDDGQVRNV